MTKKKQSAESAAREIRRRTRRRFSPEEKILIVLEGLRGEQSLFGPQYFYDEQSVSAGSTLRRLHRLGYRLSSLCHPKISAWRIR
jgi:transposase-like protein